MTIAFWVTDAKGFNGLKAENLVADVLKVIDRILKSSTERQRIYVECRGRFQLSRFQIVDLIEMVTTKLKRQADL